MNSFTSASYLPWNSSNGYSESDYWIWCPSLIQADDGTWRMFASRWPGSLPFHPSWLTNSEIIMAKADYIEGPYTFVKTIFPARGGQWWDGRMTHNPRVLRYSQGFAMFYLGTTHPLANTYPGESPNLNDSRVIAARAGKRVGVALAKDIEGPWTRFESPILPTKPDTFYSFLTSNPAPCIEPDGSVFLVFKARAWAGDVHGPMTLGVARADSPTGPYKVLGQIRLDTDIPHELEDPFCWKSHGLYHLIAKDMTGSLCGEPRAGVHAVSVNGVEWKLADPIKAYSRTIPLVGGGNIELGSLERVSIIFQNGTATHLAAAVGDGHRGFTTATRTWNALLPLKDQNHPG